MNNNLVFNQRESRPLAVYSLLRATSLLYLKDALERERYEECVGLIQSARSYGATSGDIGRIIAGYIRRLNGGQSGAGLTRSRRFT